LYAHHLSRCPSYSLTNNVITGPFRKNDLLRLKTKFAAEVRRNLFEAYMRPRETLVNLISINASSSAAFPGGEAFRFAFSPNGRTVLALNSSRIYVLDLMSDPIAVRRELKTLRRPLSASITDDGSLLAVQSSKHQANIYALTPDGVRHVQVLVLDYPPRTIALAPEGTVLAVAYEGGVEVFSLAVNALSTDRRAVRSEAVDSLMFSGDGSVLVGSTHDLEEPHAVVITAPFYTENDLTPQEVHSRMWTTQILFPQISSICSHAELLQGHTEGDANWLFAFDHTLMSYRAVRTDDTRIGVAYFLNPTSSRRFSLPAPSTAPTATACGTLVVAGFTGSGLCIYGVPERLDVSPDMGSVVERHEQRLQGRIPLTSATGHLEPLMAYSPSISGSSEEIEDDSLAAKVDWRQSLFVKCRRLKSIDGHTAAKWVERSETRPCGFTGKRLVVVAPGGVNDATEELGESMPVDGSRLCILDFDYAPSSGANREITIEVGDKEPDLLTEHSGNLEVEVAMERRRTVRERARGGLKMPLGRSVTTITTTPSAPNYQWGVQRRPSTSQPSSPTADVDGPLGNVSRGPEQPSQSGLHRSATAAGFYSARYPPRPPLASTPFVDSGHMVYHRVPGQRYPEDGWESPPPPYSTGLGPQTQYRTALPGGPSLAHPSPIPFSSFTPPPLSAQIPGTLAGISEDLHVSSRDVTPVRQEFAPAGLTPNLGPRGGAVPTVAALTPASGRISTALDGNAASGNALARHNMSPHGGLTPPPGLIGNREPRLTVVPESNRGYHAGPSFQEHGGSPVLTPEFSRDGPRPALSNGRSPSAEPFLPGPTGANHVALPPSSDRVQPRFSEPFHTTQKPVSSGSLTLSGANLQNRLNHPVPPTPRTPEREREQLQEQEQLQQHSVYMTTAPQTGPQGGGPSPTPPAAGEGFVLAPPTADQIANLHRHVSQTRQRPISVLTSGAYLNSSAAGDFGPVPPSPPRGAWGAAGIPGSPSFNRAISTPNGLSRNNSRGSYRSSPAPSSTPNLQAPPTQRPQYGRLETIESISSTYGRGEPTRSRTHSVAHDQGSPPMHTNEHSAGRGRRRKDKERRGIKCIVM